MFWSARNEFKRILRHSPRLPNAPLCCHHDKHSDDNGGDEDADWAGQLNYLKSELIRTLRIGISVPVCTVAYSLLIGGLTARHPACSPPTLVQLRNHLIVETSQAAAMLLRFYRKRSP